MRCVYIYMSPSSPSPLFLSVLLLPFSYLTKMLSLDPSPLLSGTEDATMKPMFGTSHLPRVQLHPCVSRGVDVCVPSHSHCPLSHTTWTVREEVGESGREREGG